MNILIIGASQGTGALAVRAALEKGHHVTAFARSPQKLTRENPQLRKVAGDFHQAASVEAAVPGHDAVIVTASATALRAFKENPRYFSQGTGYTIDAIRPSNPCRARSRAPTSPTFWSRRARCPRGSVTPCSSVGERARGGSGLIVSDDFFATTGPPSIETTRGRAQ